MVQSNNQKKKESTRVQHIFIIGSKSIGQYGGYETFVERLIDEHENTPSIKYHVACKANGAGFMDESRLSSSDVTVIKKNTDGFVAEFVYKNTHVFKIKCPNIGPPVAVYYDRAALQYALNYCRENNIEHPIFYILTCRIGLFIKSLVWQIKELGGKYYLNPDGHEWMRRKWPKPVRWYWKWSEKKMVRLADLVICDSINIQKYIRTEYAKANPKTTYIAYGADITQTSLSDNDERFTIWLREHGLEKNNYYLAVGRFVPENNYKTIIQEFMRSQSSRDLVIIANTNERMLDTLDRKIGWRKDKRIKFTGTVYDHALLKKIRESAHGYMHGHEVGGTNPSLLEALGSTKLNLVYDVSFNREVCGDIALYWTKEAGNLAELVDRADEMSEDERELLGEKARERIKEAYSWTEIGNEYMNIWMQGME